MIYVNVKPANGRFFGAPAQLQLKTKNKSAKEESPDKKYNKRTRKTWRTELNKNKNQKLKKETRISEKHQLKSR